MRKSLVIGYGNSLRSDDAVGLYVVRELQARMRHEPVEFIECHQLTTELAYVISAADFVFFVDASTDGVAGEIRYRELFPASVSAASTHFVDPAGLLTIARQLYGRSPEALLATITGECFGFGRQLSPEVRQSAEGVARNIERILRSRHPSAASA